MVFKNTSTIEARGGRRTGHNSAFSLLELLVASTLALLVCLAIILLAIFSSRSFVAVANYVQMDERSQLALDKMSREIRQTRRLTHFTPHSVTFEDADSKTLRYVFNEKARQLVRVRDGTFEVYLRDCDELQFAKFQRTPISNSFDAYPTASITNTKLLQVSWTCSRKILGAKMNTESVQSAKIVIRNN